MEKVKTFGFGMLAILLIIPIAMLLTACGESYEIEYGTYKIVGYQAINNTTNEVTNYGVEDTLPVALKWTADLTLNSDGTVTHSSPESSSVEVSIVDAYTIDSEGKIEFTYKGEFWTDGYFDGDVLYYNFGSFKSTEDIRNNTPDSESTYYQMYAVYTLNGTPLPTDDNAETTA